jgi:flagellar motor switch protein FliN/FliY
MKLGNVQQVKVPVQIVLGETDLTLAEVASLSVGSIVGVRSLAGEPVDFVVSGETVARGEVVIIDENFGIRLTKMVDKGTP